MLRRLRGEAGVAMVTVIFVGAALTALASVATIATIEEFKAGGEDRRGSQALAYAEAGVDRMISYLRGGTTNFLTLNKAGCPTPLTLPIGNLGAGATYEVSLRVYNPAATGAARFPIGTTGGACANRPVSPHPGQDGSDNTFFVIDSTGKHPAASRTVRQVISVQPLKLPIGIFANTITKQSAKHDFSDISMVAKISINNRSNMAFSGVDKYYKMSDFFPGGVTNTTASEAMPAAAHSVGTIYTGKNAPEEFAGGTKNCAANPLGTTGQSLWDSDGSTGSGSITSGCSGQTGWPNSSKFTQAQLEAIMTPKLSEADYQVIKDAAKANGVYCSFPGLGGTGSTTCIKQGVAQAGDGYASMITSVITSGTRNVISYFEFRTGPLTLNNIGSLPSVNPCSDDPAVHKSLVVVVRNGGIDYGGGGGTNINGALLLDGNFSGQGSFILNGSITANQIDFQSSSQEFGIDDCWIKNMPSSFLKVVPGQWSEVDR